MQKRKIGSLEVTRSTSAIGNAAAGWNLTPADLQEIDGQLRADAEKATTT